MVRVHVSCHTAMRTAVYVANYEFSSLNVVQRKKILRIRDSIEEMFRNCLQDGGDDGSFRVPDVGQLLNVGNLLTFQRFVARCAARSGQLLNLHSLAGDCGISQPTARQWLTVLQASHLVTLLAPHHRNFGKRLVKTPKLYFLDSGLLCHLLRIASPDDLHAHAMRGAVFERWVVGETLKHRHNLGLPPDLYFWRDNHGLEVDLVFEQGGRLHSVECKSGTTYSPSWLDSVRRWRALLGDAAADPVLVYGGEEGHRGADYEVLGWRAVGVG